MANAQYKLTDMACPPFRLAVTGTDTGVGKTIVARSILAASKDSGLVTSALKPVETGVDIWNGDRTTDAELLKSAAGMSCSIEDIRPIAFESPLSPMTAAMICGSTINIDLLDSLVIKKSLESDILLIEGAGGLMVPFSPDLLFLDLIARWECELIIVAPNRLGTINHTLLTVAAARNSGISIKAIVLNNISIDGNDLSQRYNYSTIKTMISDINIIDFPLIANISDNGELISACHDCGLFSLVSQQWSSND